LSADPAAGKKNRDYSQLTQPPEENRSFSAAFLSPKENVSYGADTNTKSKEIQILNPADPVDKENSDESCNRFLRRNNINQ
jgi:hypothetical protein